MSLLRVVVFLVCACSCGMVHAQEWEEISSEKGVVSYRKDVPGSDIVAFKGTATVYASIPKILWVLTDNEHKTKWVHRLKKSVVLERPQRNEGIIYQHFEMPFPVTDREYVYHGKVTRKGDEVFIHLKSTEHPKAPPAVGVRAQLTQCIYHLVPLSPNLTKVMVEVHTDPKGSLPAWLVNMVQKEWPLRTLSGLKRMVHMPFVGEIDIPGVVPTQ